MTPRPAALLALLALAAPAAAQAPARAAASAVPAAAHAFALVRSAYSGERARGIVAFMDRWWRLPGNRGYDASIDTVAAVLRAAGYVPEGRARPGDRLTYRIESKAMAQPTWEPESASVAIVGDGAPLLRSATNRNMLAINSRATPAGGVEAEVVRVSAPVDSALARLDVRGKIVYADGPVGRLFAAAVQRGGALGVLAYDMPGYLKPQVHRNTIQFRSIPLDTARRAWAIMLSTAARDRLRARLAAGPVRLRVAVAAASPRGVDRTVVAEVRGSVRPEQRFVFSAHVQEPGANDNASGVGAQAEMARVLAGLVRSGRADPRRTITFLWGNEIAATAAFLADSARTRGVRWGMSLDMVGENTALTGGTFLIEKMPDPSAVWTRGEDRHTEWGGEPLREAQIVPHYFNDFVLARCLDQAAATGWVVRTNPFEGGSDHTPFLRAGKPGLLLWHFTDEFYHTDGDRIDKVSAATLTNVGTSALVSAMVLASADGAAARAIVAELEGAAGARLAAERAIARDSVAAGGDRAREAHILRTWGRYYRDAIRAAAEIEVGGASPTTRATIAAASARVQRLAVRLATQVERQ
ncbi:MAG: M28 family peptidase [Gemmatimonadaceae bacterium]